MAANDNRRRTERAADHGRAALDCLSHAEDCPEAASGLLRAAARHFDLARVEAERLRGRPMDQAL